MKRSEITKRANEWLSLAKVTTTPVPILEVAKRMGVRVRVGPMPDELSGFLLHENGEAVLGVNSLHSKARQTFTIAHELGHFALHPKANFVDHKVLYFRNALSSQATDSKEMDANQFAADLLMPEQMLRTMLKGEALDLEDSQQIELLAARFGVSTQALTFRLSNLKMAAQS